MKKFLLFLLLVFGFEMAAQTHFSAKLDTNQIKLGEPIQVKIEATIPEGTAYIWPILSDSLNGIEIIEQGKIDSLEKGGQLILQQEISITSFDSGEVYLPRLELKLGDQVLQSDSSLIRVFFPEIKEDQDYFDIKGPREIPFDYWSLLWYALAIIVLALGIFYLIKKWPKKDLGELGPVVEVDPRSPRQWALDALKDLESQELWQKGEVKAYYSELIDILRHFLEREYGMKAMESTADELIEKLKAKVSSSDMMKELSQSLRLSAMVKYARQKALVHENEQALNAIRKFVDQHQKEESSDV